MPAWITPLLRPVWCRPTSCSFSSTQTLSPGRRISSSRATASPRMPAPTTARSQSPEASVVAGAVTAEEARAARCRLAPRRHHVHPLVLHEAAAVVQRLRRRPVHVHVPADDRAAGVLGHEPAVAE